MIMTAGLVLQLVLAIGNDHGRFASVAARVVAAPIVAALFFALSFGAVALGRRLPGIEPATEA